MNSLGIRRMPNQGGDMFVEATFAGRKSKRASTNILPPPQDKVT